MGEIFSIDNLREKKVLQTEEKNFKKYLGALKQEELQYEADHLLNNLDDSNLSEKFLLKSALLMEELAKRVDAQSISQRISNYSSELRDKLNGKQE